MVDLIDREALLESIHLLDMDVLNRYEQSTEPLKNDALSDVRLLTDGILWRSPWQTLLR